MQQHKSEALDEQILCVAKLSKNLCRHLDHLQFAQMTVDDDDIYSVTNEFLGARTICSLSGGAVSRSECKDEKLGQI